MAEIDDALKQGAADWVDFCGNPATYFSGCSGETFSFYVVIDKDIEVVDQFGGFIRRTVASFESGQVEPTVADVITTQGIRYRVEEAMDDPGYITRVLVSRL